MNPYPDDAAVIAAMSRIIDGRRRGGQVTGTKKGAAAWPKRKRVARARAAVKARWAKRDADRDADRDAAKGSNA